MDDARVEEVQPQARSNREAPSCWSRWLELRRPSILGVVARGGDEPAPSVRGRAPPDGPRSGHLVDEG